MRSFGFSEGGEGTPASPAAFTETFAQVALGPAAFAETFAQVALGPAAFAETFAQAALGPTVFAEAFAQAAQAVKSSSGHACSSTTVGRLTDRRAPTN